MGLDVVNVIERLRHDRERPSELADRLCHDAADLIEAQAVEIQQLKSKLDQSQRKQIAWHLAHDSMQHKLAELQDYMRRYLPLHSPP